MSDNPFLHETEAPKKNVFGEVVQALIVALIFNVVIYFLFIIPSQVDGPSMLPTLVDKELLFANKTPSWLNSNPSAIKQLGWDYARGDILIFDFNDIVLVKRVIGIPGDKVKITSDGDVYVNGVKLYEYNFLPSGLKTYLPTGDIRTFEPDTEVTVPDDKFFLLGDNRNNSKDSRYSEVGFVPREKIKGVVFFRSFRSIKLD